ncbi:MAG: class I SAM-dependent methyltransferase [Deltaproteobacteria bacterium]|jgi:ubiquinone/menaquinone biosynthesis C-methylase UbiE|nr:class I SAM-dependent methyltransferase [Deltaproteobacteria bacterium]
MNFAFADPLFRQAAHQVAGLALRPGGLDLTRQALQLCNWPQGIFVIDVGCGAGATLGLLSESGFKTKGFDLSPAMVREAAMNSGCPVEVADAVKLPLQDSSVGAVVCECLLSILPEADSVLAEFYRVLVPGGGLLLADVTADTPLAAALWLEKQGFAVLQTLNHPKALKALAAQLVWLGAKPEDFCCLEHRRASACNGAPSDYTPKGAGYYQWIACKPDKTRGRL